MNRQYESDLGRREKCLLRWKTICDLKGRKRLEYLWTYYKWLAGLLAAVVLLVYTGETIFRNSIKDTVLSVVIVDAARTDEQAAAELEKKLLELLECKGKHDHIELVLSATSREDEYNLAKLRVALSSAGGADVVVCGSGVYEEYALQDAFTDAELLPEDSILAGYIGYSPAYLCILRHSERTEDAGRMLKTIVNQQ